MICDHDYDYYAVNEDNKLVYGFDCPINAKDYCDRNKFKLMTRDMINKANIISSDWDNWSDDYPE